MRVDVWNNKELLESKLWSGSLEIDGSERNVKSGSRWDEGLTKSANI